MSRESTHTPLTRTYMQTRKRCNSSVNSFVVIVCQIFVAKVHQNLRDFPGCNFIINL